MLQHIWLILFIVWGLPLTIYRSKFRKIVYNTDSWTINIKPYFGKEIKALFGTIYPENKKYIKFRNFYRVYLLIYILLSVCYFAFKPNHSMNEIKVGSIIPSFSLLDQNGQLFLSDSVIGKKNLVIYFYPKDDSPGCTKEACSFRDQFDVFNQADALIIGISSQSVESHKKFAEKHRLNYTLLADEKNVVRKQFGVPANFFGLISGRVTYIVNKEGKVVYIFNSQLQAEKHVEEALTILKNLN